MELGTFKGHNTVLFAHHASPEAKVFTLDLEPTEVVKMGVKPVEGDLRAHAPQTAHILGGGLISSRDRP
jgi:hypothetical protein